MFLLVYVADIILIGSPTALFDALLHTLSTEFTIKDLGPLHHLIGIEVHYELTGILLT